MTDSTSAIAALERVRDAAQREIDALVSPRSNLALLRDKAVTSSPAAPPPPPSIPSQVSAPPPPPPLAPAHRSSEQQGNPAAPAGSTGPGERPPSRGAWTARTPTLEWLFRIGGISLVVLAAVFFVSTAISRGWISPVGQLVLATCGSFGLIAQAFRFLPKRRTWAVTFAGGGASGVFVSGVIGHLGLELLSLRVVAGWLAGAIVLFVVLAKIMDSEVLAGLGGVATATGALLLVSDGASGAPTYFVAGITWVAALLAVSASRDWHVARSLGGLVGGFVLLGAVGLAADEGMTALTIVATLAGIGVVCALARDQIRSFVEGGSKPLANLEARVAAGTVPWIGLMTGIAVVGSTSLPDESAGAVLVAVGIACLLGLQVLRASIPSTMHMLHSVASVGTVALGAAVAIDGPGLLAALLANACASAALAWRTRSLESIALATIVSSVVLLWSAGLAVSAFVDGPMSSAEIIVTAFVVAAGLLGSWWVRNHRSLGDVWLLSWVVTLTWVAAAWQGVPQAQMWISASWAAMGVAAMASSPVWRGALAGIRWRQAVYAGMVTLGLTGAKLILVDLQSVDVLWRAGLFLVVGGVFLRLAFVLPELLERARQTESLTSERVSVDS